MFGASIKLEKDLYNRCKDRAREAGYSSVEEFVAHILERELKHKDKSAEENEEVASRLRGLGYLD